MGRPATAAVRLLAGEREPVRASTGVNVTLAGLQTIDGVALAVNDRVLLRGQTDPRENGIYTASRGSWQRASDASFGRAIAEGVTVQVQEGSQNGGKAYRFRNEAPKIGTEPVVVDFYLSANFAQDAEEVIDLSLVRLTDEEAAALGRVAQSSEYAAEQAAIAEAAKEAAQQAVIEASFRFRGNWAAGTEYKLNDVVNYADSVWVARRTSTGIVPGSSAADWSVLIPGATVGDGAITRPKLASATYSTDPETKAGATEVGVINPLLLLSRLKYDGYLAVRHFGVALDGTDETAKINTALTERVPLKFPKAVVPLFGPLDLQNQGGIIGSGEATMFQRRFSGGALIRHRAGGEPIVLQDFRLHTADGQALADGDAGMEFGLVTPWAQRGILNNILIQKQYDGFHWKRGSDGVISNIVSQENVRYGFLGINPRGVLYKCNGNYNGRSGFMTYYDDTGETGVDYDLCRSFCNQYFGWEFGANGGVQTLNANANLHRTVSSFDGFGGIRMTIPFQQLMITDHLAEYHGFAQNFRPDFMQDEAAAGMLLTGGVTLASVRGFKSANNKGPGARILGADVELFDWRIHQNGRGNTSRAGLEIGAGAKVYGGGLRFTDGGTTQVDISVTDASATGQLTGVEARNSFDIGGGSLRIENVSGTMAATPTIASAATVTLRRWGGLFKIAGQTKITTLNGGWPERRVTLLFTDPGSGVGGLTDGGNLSLAGNFSPTANDTITLIFDGASWIEVSRSGDI